MIDNPSIRILGRAPLPTNAPRASIAELKTGADDARWIEVEGTVHDIVEFGHDVLLRLEISDGPIIVLMMKTPGRTYSQLVDSVVRIRGNAAPSMNSDGQIIDFHLQAPDLSTLQVVEPARGDPFSRPIIPISKLLNQEYYFNSIHRIHLRGHVTLQWPGSLICIRDAERGICAETSETIPVAVNDLVDVAGFVETDNHSPVITNALFRSVAKAPPVAPQSVTADKVLAGGFGSELIQIDGLLIGYDQASSDVVLQLSSGGTLFPAILPKSLTGSQIRDWKVGEQATRHRYCLGQRRYPESHTSRRSCAQVFPRSHAVSGGRNPPGTAVLVDPDSCTHRACSGSSLHARRFELGCDPPKEGPGASHRAPQERAEVPSSCAARFPYWPASRVVLEDPPQRCGGKHPPQSKRSGNHDGGFG